MFGRVLYRQISEIGSKMRRRSGKCYSYFELDYFMYCEY